MNLFDYLLTIGLRVSYRTEGHRPSGELSLDNRYINI